MKTFFFLILSILSISVYSQNDGPTNFVREYMGCITSGAPVGVPEPNYGCVEVYDSVNVQWYVWNHVTTTWDLQVATGAHYVPDLFEYAISMDGINNIAIPFPLKITSVIFYNNSAIRSTQWSGAGSSTLTLGFPTKEHDFIIVNKN